MLLLTIAALISRYFQTHNFLLFLLSASDSLCLLWFGYSSWFLYNVGYFPQYHGTNINIGTYPNYVLMASFLILSNFVISTTPLRYVIAIAFILLSCLCCIFHVSLAYRIIVLAISFFRNTVTDFSSIIISLVEVTFVFYVFIFVLSISSMISTSYRRPSIGW